MPEKAEKEEEKMFENRQIKIPKLGNEAVHISRIIASWRKKGGKISDVRWAKSPFADWCRNLGINDDDIRCIINFATNGKLELEDDARKFLKMYERDSGF